MSEHLICEGTCNPHLKSVDTDMREFRRVLEGMPSSADGEPERWKLPPPDDATLRRLRSLTYTRHRHVGDRRLEAGGTEHLWACERCGQVRRWGLSN